MISRKFYLSLTLTALLYVFSEVIFRIGLSLVGYPFFQPARYLEKKYYPYIEAMQEARVERGGDTRNILILGGSVVNTHWSRLEMRLDTLFQKAYPAIKKFNFFNVAMPGHNSRDNLVKYRLLKNQPYDLVIFYEAINENRANNISTEMFYPDYSHIKWYDEINLLLKHPEMNVTVIPYSIHLLIKTLIDKLKHRNYISNDQVDPAYAGYGEDIKTAASYYNNLNDIARLANKKHDPLLLVKYATFFPPGITLTGEEADKKYFTPCYMVSPVTTWGKPANVAKGVRMHNAMLEKVHQEQKTGFFNMAAVMPEDSVLFCDVCHLSEPGAQRFARELSKHIVSSGVLK
ncbi:hypothetical protein [Dyadobacter chenhuakuii]|uniref:SGNH/GDSL hydrolase family protein n=1 Tax=Dyadobacter chenhuakuii TaxID=2909339 RepID=A0ABY4XT64_9BACT|nr:hypothetical protein [Dyadobacter chenhuakuii]MCF2492393.1 hypothetical protein [Dyadobacter chenhuakuii]USJ33305.1 hypothetical protein NFI80_11245 [Dyadobacter chenhuakuii]